MHVVFAPIRLKPGVDEAALIAASDAFERDFVSRQKGIIRRHLLRAGDGSYADLVLFESREAADRVVAAEMSSPACAAFFSLMAIDESQPDMATCSYDEVRTYG
jgi:hypothetical protein